MRLLVTGCHGFIGGSAGRVAARQGHDVLGVGRASQPDRQWPGTYRSLDVAHADLAEIIRAYEPDAILHAAGTASVAASLTHPLDDLRAAVLTWANLLDGVRRSGLRPLLLFPSSAAVYGEPETLPVSEDAPTAPISPYGFHKSACELLAREYCRCFGVDVVVGRLFSVYGPRQRRLLLWELFEAAAGPAPRIVMQGTGEETRDYLHVDDVAAAFLALAERRPPGLTVLNIASGSAVRTRDLARLVMDAANVSKPVQALGATRPGDPAHWRAAIARLRDMAPVAVRPLDEGIGQCVRAWQCA